MAKKDNLPALSGPIKDYAIMAHSPESFSNTLMENMGQGQTLSVADLQRVKIPTGGSTIWQVPSITGKPENLEELEGVILFWHPHRAYWEKDMQQGGKSAPDCMSPDGMTGTKNRDSGADDRGQGGNCGNCPLAQFGSAADGRRQACKAQSRVFLLRPGRMLPTVVNLSPTSAAVMKSFLTSITAENIPYHKCMVSISLEQDMSANNVEYAKVKFSVTDTMSNDDYAAFSSFRNQMLPYLQAVEVEVDDQ